MQNTHEHLVNQIHHAELRSDTTLHVLGVIFNPMRYHSRYRLFRQWRQEMEQTANVKVYVVELAFGDRQFEVTTGLANELQLRTHQEIWLKESLINLGVRYLLPRSWKYLCWCDGDISFSDKSWALEAIQQLQHFPLMQPWQDCLDLGFNGEVLQHFQSFCYCYRQGYPMQTHPSQPYRYAHSGFAWCCTRAWYEKVRGLIEFPILGSADHHMAFGSINRMKDSVHQKMSDNFKKLADDWGKKAVAATNGQLGYIPTRIEHFFHGPKYRRQYRERWQIFIDHNFDPINDLTHDEQGLIQLKGKPRLQAACRNYLSFRNEDSIDNY